MGGGRFGLTGVLIMAISGCGAPVRSYVDRIEEGIAVVEDETGGRRRVRVNSLPPAVREGDVVVDGRIDPGERLRLEERLRTARARLEIRRPGVLDLEVNPNHRLTTDPE